MILEKYLVECGVASRKKIKKAILEGRIKINGQIEYHHLTEIDENIDTVSFDELIPSRKTLKYYIMYKVAGYITAMSDSHKKTVAELLPLNIDKTSVFPVGRLDRDTEGLLLFTNDGALSYTMAHPEREIEKTYYVELSKEITTCDIRALETGITLDTGYKALPGRVEYLTPTSINLTITEGKYRQVKKMLKAVKNKVIYLKRIKYANLTLDGIKPGEVKEIKREEIDI